MNTEDRPIKLTPPFSGTFWLHMEALGLNLPGGRRTLEKFFDLENWKSEKRRKPLKKIM